MRIIGMVLIPHSLIDFIRLKPGDEILVKHGVGVPPLKNDRRLNVATVYEDSLVTTDGTVLKPTDCNSISPTGEQKAVSEFVSWLSLIPKIGPALIRSLEGYGTWPPVIHHHSPD